MVPRKKKGGGGLELLHRETEENFRYNVFYLKKKSVRVATMRVRWFQRLYSLAPREKFP